MTTTRWTLAEMDHYREAGKSLPPEIEARAQEMDRISQQIIAGFRLWFSDPIYAAVRRILVEYEPELDVRDVHERLGKYLASGAGFHTRERRGGRRPTYDATDIRRKVLARHNAHPNETWLNATNVVANGVAREGNDTLADVRKCVRGYTKKIRWDSRKAETTQFPALSHHKFR